MNKNNFILGLITALLIASTVNAQDAAKPAAATTKKPAATAKKKINLDFENETVMGTYDVPDAQFINSRKMIKYKELFNKRTNFIDEIESNKGLFNEYQK